MDKKKAFAVSWEKELPTRELPSLDFLADEALAREQFRHSIAVIKDCLTTIQLEVFIVKFLRTHLLSDEKCADFNIGLTIDEVFCSLDSTFPRTRNRSDGACYSHYMKAFSAKKKRANIANFQFPSHEMVANVDKSTSPINGLDDFGSDSLNLHDHETVTCEDTTKVETISPAVVESETKENSADEKASDDAKTASSENENDMKASTSPSASMTEHENVAVTCPESAENVDNKVTIFTPTEDKHIEFDTNLSPANESQFPLPPSTDTAPQQPDDASSSAVVSDEQKSPTTTNELSQPPIGRTLEAEDEVQSSGNELDVSDNPEEHHDPFSSDSGSSSPVREAFLGDRTTLPNSDEILNIMPLSSRASFYSVDPSFENTQFQTAEHIYEDVEKFRTPIEGEVGQVRHLSQSELSLRKTFSAGGVTCRKDKDDDVFVKRSKASQAEANQRDHSDILPVPENVSATHKRSSSDAGVSYNVRSNITRDRRARRDKLAFRVIDQQDLTLSDGSEQTIQSPLQQAVDDAHKLHMRKWVVAGLVDSERGYLEALEKLTRPMKPIKASLTSSSPICTIFDFHKIFHKVEDLYKIHVQFLADMEERVSHWSLKQIIGDLFTALMDQFKVYEEYIRNNTAATETIAKCKISERFQNIFTQEITLLSTQEIITYENLFRKPLERIARYILVMDDLIKYTPEEHPDYEMLQTFMKRAQAFLERNYSNRSNIGIKRLTRRKKDRKLLKDAFVVELVDGLRKFRHLFLFSDVFVSAKLKVTNRSEQFAIKWYCSMHDILFYPTENSESAQTVPVTSNFEIDNLKAKIAAIKADIRQEQGMSEGYTSKQLEKNYVGRTASVTSRTAVSGSTKTMEKLKRKLAEQEAALWLALPSLPLTIYRRSGKTHRFLFPSDVARGDWKREIGAQQKTGKVPRSPLSPLEIQGLAETCLEMRTVRSLGSVNLKDDDNVFTGIFYVVVNSGKGFIKPIDCYVVLEVDYYGHYVRKARTKMCKATQDPVWEQGFHIEVEGTQFIKILCYNRARMMGDELCGQGTIKLEKRELGDCHYHDYTVILDKQGCILMSIQYSTTLEGIHHRRSVSTNGVFGVSLDTVVEREKSEIPLVVIACCKEIERRGMNEVGIYRVSGVSSDVKRLKEKFDENSQEALVYISEADIHAVAGAVKQYFRELPDPLFTGKLYPKFTEALGMTDEDEKEKHLLDLLEHLSPSRKATALFLIDHLRRVSQSEDENKMSLGNLATIFGPNLLRPPPTEKPANATDTSMSIAMEMASGTFNVMSQTSIFYWFLRSKSSKVKLPTTPDITRRLFPAQKEVVIQRLSSQSEEKLI